MKKVFIFLLCILVLTGCGQGTKTIELPDIEEIVSIDVTTGKSTINHSDKKWIDTFLTTISKSTLTKRQSVQDTPMVENYKKIDIELEDGASTLFVYENNGKFFVEQPYVGIYQTDSKFYDLIKEMITGNYPSKIVAFFG